MLLCIFISNCCSTMGNFIFTVKNTYITAINKFLISFDINKSICIMSFFCVISFFVKAQKYLSKIISSIVPFATIAFVLLFVFIWKTS